MFIRAEKFGIKSGLAGLPQYSQELSSIGTRSQLDKYFTMAMNVYPDNGYLDLQYAKGLARLNSSKADEFFNLAISKRDPGDFQPLTSYAENLLDKGKYQKAFEVLQQWSDSEGNAFYLHFLKGYALEKLRRLKEAQEEYQEFQNAQTGTTPEATQLLKSFLQIPSKYRIPRSELQKGLPFKTEAQGAIRTSSVSRNTSAYCAADDWYCKAKYYLIWTINGEAERGGGTIGMMRAVAWNIRTRTFWPYTSISCAGSPFTCTNYASGYPVSSPSDTTGLWKRYVGVISTGNYQGLLVGTYTSLSQQVATDVIVNGNVPDPNAGACFPYGNPTVGGIGDGGCTGTCGYNAGYWDSFRQSQSSNEFRGGKLVYKNVSSSCQIATLVPIGTPAGGTCGANCFSLRGVICPRTGHPKCSGSCSDYCNYDTWTGWTSKNLSPVYGNFFWHF